MSALEALSHSPKKRKVEIDASEKSKKKRRKQTEHNIEKEQSADSTAIQVKEKKRKNKHKSVQPVPEENGLAPETNNEKEDHLPTSQTVVEEEIPTQAFPDRNGEYENISEAPEVIEEVDESLMLSAEASCFYSKRLSLYVPIPAIALATSTSSLLSLHLTPLILTYFPPAGGIVLAFSDPVLSAKSEAGVNLPLRSPTSAAIPRNPLDETFAQCAEQFGVCWVWLTATFLVFAPQPGDTFKGWANVQSESFIGLISYNYFQTSIMRNRIPPSWTFIGPRREQAPRKKSRKGRLNGENDVAGLAVDMGQTADASDQEPTNLLDGSFQDHNSEQISANQVIRVYDVDMTPGAERNRYGLQIEGSLLSAEEEKALLQEEKRQHDDLRRRRPRSQTPGAEQADGSLMSGALQ